MEDVVLALGLLLIGYGLMAVEAFVIPGFGITGIGGILLMGTGSYIVWSGHGAAIGLATVAISVTVAVVGGWLVARSRAAGKMILSTENKGEATDRERMLSFVGCKGEATSDLRPSGTALFGDERLQVMTDGDYVPKGTAVEVVRLGTNTLIVTRWESPAEADDDGDDTNGQLMSREF